MKSKKLPVLSKKMRKAMYEVIATYRYSIANPSETILAWCNSYGSFSTCKLCLAAEYKVGGEPDCGQCPLGFDKDIINGDVPCVTPSYNALEDFFGTCMDFNRKNKLMFKNLLKSRLKYLLRKFKPFMTSKR